LEFKREDVGRKIESILRHPDFLAYLKSKQYDNALTVKRLQGQQRTYHVQIIPYFESHKLLIVRDISELYNLAQVRRDFIANASHELRTPLTVLKGYLEVMLDTPGTHQTQWQGALQNMQNQSDRMQAILEDLLVLSRMESEALAVNEEEVDVPDMLRKLEIEANQLSQGAHQLEFFVENTLWLKGSAEPLKSVFMNLVSNAIRYTPAGGVIKVRWSKEKNGAQFSVTDNGIGIAPEHISRITERFYRVDTARSRGTGGTGLGLAIVKHILERHGSALSVNSVLGKGSTFSCNFAKSKVLEVP
jgi:two-component system phosphate regulon sensor histidine kinase PhoR